MTKNIIYGASSSDLEALKEKIEKIFNIKFDTHTDVDDQDYYFSGSISAENFEIRLNLNEAYNHWILPQHKSYQTLFSINNTSRSEEFKKLLGEKSPELVLLEEFEE